MLTTELLGEIIQSDLLDTFYFINATDEDEDEEDNDELLLKMFAAKVYVGVRLKPLLDKDKLNAEQFDSICDLFTECFLEQNISLDILINCLYNFINRYHKCPSDKRLSDIQAFLEDYSEE